MAAISENARCITINTGNILSMNDITKKVGQTPSEEVSDVSVKLTATASFIYELAYVIINFFLLQIYFLLRMYLFIYLKYSFIITSLQRQLK